MLVLSCVLFSTNTLAKGIAGSKSTYESRQIIDMPTAGVLPKSTLALNSTIGHDGMMSLEMNAALFQDFMMGLSYSGSKIVGSGDPEFQEYPGIHIRYRVFNETQYVPAITIGAQTQGRGLYVEDAERFQTLSPGIFIASSKAFEWWGGFILLHGGLNLSFDTDKRKPNLYLGMEQSLGERTSFLVEYNANIDDDDPVFAKKKGLFNMALRWAASEDLTLELQLRDIFGNQNQDQYKEFTRFFGLDYVVAC